MSRNRLKPLYSLFLIFLATITCADILYAQNQKKDRYVFTSPHMGTMFRVVVYASEERLASLAADSAFQRVEELNNIFSDYKDDSELNRLSATATTGEWVNISQPLFKVLRASLVVSEETEGAFDVTAGPLVRLWRDIRQDEDPQLPNNNVLKKALEAVGYHNLELDETEQKAMLATSGMQFDLGGIAKGYAAEEMLNVFQHFGIGSALIDAGGDMVTGAAPPGREGWDIAVFAHDQSGEPDPFVLTLEHKAISTSGDRFQFVEIDGKRYSHIIDPQTGYGITKRRMVTIIGKNGMYADAYATGLSIYPVQKGLELIENKYGYSAYIEVRENDTIDFFYTNDIKELRDRNAK